mmetsp:Transcript_8713/g.7719  ORF Transcript_8713/g.7719 Transcript_8713/m.7719 type:complete len:81 (-) Transcript_8713:24-266(-)
MLKKMRKSKLSIDTSGHKMPKVGRINISKLVTADTSNSFNLDTHSKGVSHGNILDTNLKEALTPVSAISFKFSALSGIDD